VRCICLIFVLQEFLAGRPNKPLARWLVWSNRYYAKALDDFIGTMAEAIETLRNILEEDSSSNLDHAVAEAAPRDSSGDVPEEIRT
jgi:hypothetical protein